MKNSAGTVEYRLLRKYRDKANKSETLQCVIKDLAIGYVTPEKILTSTFRDKTMDESIVDDVMSKYIAGSIDKYRRKKNFQFESIICIKKSSRLMDILYFFNQKKY